MQPRTGLLLAASAGAGATAALAVLRREQQLAADEPMPDLRGERFKVETNDGAVLHAHAAGRGPLAVLPHCWMGSSAVWTRVAADLVERGYRVVRYDQRGHGQSTVGADGCTIARLGDDLEEVLTAVDASAAVVAGHSMGGLTIQAFGIRHPDALRDRVGGAVFVSTAAVVVSRGTGRFAPYVLGRPVVDRSLRGPRGPSFVRGVFGARPRYTDLVVARDGVLTTAPKVRLEFLRSMNEMDHREGLRTFHVPSIVLVGGHDTVTPPSDARVLTDALPDAHLQIVDGAGHMLPLERASVVAAAIVDLHR